MKHTLLGLILFLGLAMNSTASQQNDRQQEAAKIGVAIAHPFFSYDFSSVSSIIEALVNSNREIRGVELYDNKNGSIVINAYKSDESTLDFNTPILPEQLESLDQVRTPVVYQDEEIGRLHLYFTYRGGDNLELTPEEQNWIENHRKLRFSGDPHYEPFEFQDYKGDYSGMASEYLAIIEKRLGLQFEYVPGLSWSQVLEGLKTKHIDFAPVVTNTEKRREFSKFTRSYLNFPQVIVTRTDFPPINGMKDLNGKIVAVTRDYSEVKNLSRLYPSIKQYPVDTPLDELKAVSTGKADASQGNQAVISYLINKHNFPNLHLAAPSELHSGELGIAVRRDWPVLVSIFNKTLASISQQEINAIQENWVLIDEPATPRYEFPVRAFLLAFVLLAFILLVLLAIMRRMPNVTFDRMFARRKSPGW